MKDIENNLRLAVGKITLEEDLMVGPGDLEATVGFAVDHPIKDFAAGQDGEIKVQGLEVLRIEDLAEWMDRQIEDPGSVITLVPLQ